MRSRLLVRVWWRFEHGAVDWARTRVNAGAHFQDEQHGAPIEP